MLLENTYSKDPVYQTIFFQTELSEEFGIVSDLKQMPIWVSNLRLSDILDSTAKDHDNVDQAFKKITIAKFVPAQIKEVTKQAIPSVKSSSALVYESE